MKSTAFKDSDTPECKASALKKVDERIIKIKKRLKMLLNACKQEI